MKYINVKKKKLHFPTVHYKNVLIPIVIKDYIYYKFSNIIHFFLCLLCIYIFIQKSKRIAIVYAQTLIRLSKIIEIKEHTQINNKQYPLLSKHSMIVRSSYALQLISRLSLRFSPSEEPPIYKATNSTKYEVRIKYPYATTSCVK